MEVFRIKKVGKNNTVYTTASREQFERVYKPKGWERDDRVIETNDYVVHSTDEITIKNIEKSKKPKPSKFDDKIIKE